MSGVGSSGLRAEMFWPPADELAMRAQAIRAGLGEWPAAESLSRICLTLPPVIGTGDVLVFTAVSSASPSFSLETRRAWLDAGAAVVNLTEEKPRARLLLTYGAAWFELQGFVSDNWLPALAAFLDCGFPIQDALCLAMAWREADDGGPASGGFGNWPCDLSTFPRVLGLADAPAEPFAACPDKLGLYPVVPTAEWVERLLEQGVPTVQLRAKLDGRDAIADTSALEAQIRRAVNAGRRTKLESNPEVNLDDQPEVQPEADLKPTVNGPVEAALGFKAAFAQTSAEADRLAENPLDERLVPQSSPVEPGADRADGARVFINDHWRAALETGAYGVHLGQEDLATADLDAIASSGLRLGLSSHGYYEILLALHYRPSYLAIGAVFPTATKEVASAPQGLARLARYVALLDGVVPLVAIGGIDLATLPAVLSTGVGSAAVVRAVTQAPDLAEAIAALQHEFTA